MTVDLGQAKKRLLVMVALDTVCLLIAGAGAIGAFVYGIDAAKWAFGLGMAGAFIAQIWFVAGFRRPSGGL